PTREVRLRARSPEAPASGGKAASSTHAETHALTVALEAAGSRFDAALARALPQYSRSRLRAWIDAGRVTLDGRVAAATQRVRGGARVALRSAAEPDAAAPNAEAIALAIVHEDDALLVVDKPAGLVVHPGAGNRTGTLQNALLHHAPGLAAVPRSGIVH